MITLEAKALREAAAEAAAVAVSGRETVPILANVLLSATEDGLKLRSTDLDSQLVRSIAVEQGDTFETTVSAKYLSAIAAKLPADCQVSLSMEGNTQLKIAAGRSRFTLQTLPPEEFPTIGEGEWAAEFEIEAPALAGLIDAIGFAQSTEDTRYYLNGIFLHRFELDGVPKLRAAATDGHRLARYQLDLPEGAETLPEAGVIVPRRACGTIRRLIDHLPATVDGEKPHRIAVAVSAAMVRLELGTAVYVSKLIDGQYPDYSRVVPVGHGKVMKAERAALKEAVERVATISTERARVIKLDLGEAGDVLRLEVNSPDTGLAVEEVACDYGPASAREPLTIGFNVRYALDLLGHLDAAEVAVELGDAQAASLWRDAGESGDGLTRLYVLMPMRV